ncbi:MAG: trigger factor [Isosphaeraceae bacterium]
MSSSESTVVSEDQAASLLEGRKVDYSANISEVGPCRKKIKITIPESEIEFQSKQSMGEFRKEAQVPGFRPGRVPHVLLQKRFRKEMGDRVKMNLMISALDQLEKDHKLNLLSQPQFDFEKVVLPESGSMSFEIEIEVRPTFEAPSIEGLKVNRPVKEMTDARLEKAYKAFLERYATEVPKNDEPAAMGDLVTADLVFSDAGREINTAVDVTFRLQKELRFQDGRVPELAKALVGVKAGESRETKAQVGSGSADILLRGREIDVKFNVKDVKFLRPPEHMELVLERVGFETEDQLKEALKGVIEERDKSLERQAVRSNLMDQLIAATPFDLPRDLVNRQVRDTLRKRMMDLRDAGLEEWQIRARESELRANAFESTIRGLKEYFILDKIATDNEIKVDQADIELEIERIAELEDLSPRRVRSRLEKENSLDLLSIQIIENKAVDFILEKAEITDVAVADEEEVETVAESASPAGLADHEAEAEAEKADAEAKSSAEAGDSDSSES